MKLKIVNLVIRADVDDFLERRERERLPPAVEHKTAHGIIGKVFRGSGGKFARTVETLLERTRSPIRADGGFGANAD